MKEVQKLQVFKYCFRRGLLTSARWQGGFSSSHYIKCLLLITMIKLKRLFSLR